MKSRVSQWSVVGLENAAQLVGCAKGSSIVQRGASHFCIRDLFLKKKDIATTDDHRNNQQVTRGLRSEYPPSNLVTHRRPLLPSTMVLLQQRLLPLLLFLVSNIGSSGEEGSCLANTDGSCVAASEQACDDSHERCDYWASIGECRVNPNWMEVNCRKSCNVCGSATAVYVCRWIRTTSTLHSLEETKVRFGVQYDSHPDFFHFLDRRHLDHPSNKFRTNSKVPILGLPKRRWGRRTPGGSVKKTSKLSSNKQETIWIPK
jgi:hypothetical protein